MRQYKSRGGRMLWKATLEELHDMDNEDEGLCIACGERLPIEPDAHKQVCEVCGNADLYGATELMLMGAYDE